jgi:hypothetical protein
MEEDVGPDDVPSDETFRALIRNVQDHLRLTTSEEDRKIAIAKESWRMALKWKGRKEKMPKTQKALTCTCGDCFHWEIIGIAVTPGPKPHDVMLKCMTCKHEFKAVMKVDPHEKLVEVDVKA